MSSAHPGVRPLRITLRPASEAHDYAAYADTLADNGLLNGAVAVSVFRIPLLAVPVGGARRGGCLVAGSDCRIALAICDALTGWTGFPDVRVMEARRKWVVAWGESEPEPGWDLVHPDRLRFYGYSAAAIARRALAGI
ncbi:DUF6302 family protein [Streptomyces sp. NBC_00344]|uniref:DUF6302 family protein n=1 Tax=Streptomyces sp. NBC_00344 TaxID=2975720 RepID=UPI002E23130D